MSSAYFSAIFVRDVDKEENGAEYTTLHHAGLNSFPFGCNLAYLDTLSAIAKVASDPVHKPRREVLGELDKTQIYKYLWQKIFWIGDLTKKEVFF